MLLFVASGCAALIYEVVWFHLLRLVIGGSWISLGILLASFMGGMCLGSIAAAVVRAGPVSSAAGLCGAGAGDRRDRRHAAVVAAEAQRLVSREWPTNR